MQNSRFLWFCVCIGVGVAAGLVYGWAIHPLRSNNTSLQMLSADYKADYALMVAEVYRTEQDSGMAALRLAVLGDAPPLRMVQEAIITAGHLSISTADLDLLVRLSQGLSQKPVPMRTAAPAAGGTP